MRKEIKFPPSFDSDSFQGKITGRVVCQLASESPLTASELSWSIQLMQEVWQRHEDVQLFVADPNVVELGLRRLLLLDPCPEKVETRFLALVSSVSGKLTLDHVAWINTLSRNIFGSLSGTGRDRDVSLVFLQTLLCSLNREVLAGVEPEIFSLMFNGSSADLCDRLTVAVAKIR